MLSASLTMRIVASRCFIRIREPAILARSTLLLAPAASRCGLPALDALSRDARNQSGQGAVFDLVLDDDGRISRSLEYYLRRTIAASMTGSSLKWKQLKQNLYDQWIVFHDLNPTNILVKRLGFDEFQTGRHRWHWPQPIHSAGKLQRSLCAQETGARVEPPLPPVVRQFPGVAGLQTLSRYLIIASLKRLIPLACNLTHHALHSFWPELDPGVVQVTAD